MATINLPVFSGRLATWMAACKMAPEEMPTNRPSSAAARRAMAKASSLLTAGGVEELQFGCKGGDCTFGDTVYSDKRGFSDQFGDVMSDSHLDCSLIWAVSLLRVVAKTTAI